MDNQPGKSRVIAYVRVSTRLQAENDTPKNQRRIIMQYAQGHGLEVVEWFEDVMTGAVAERDGFQRMISALDDASVSGVVVAEISRLIREEEIGDGLMHAMKAKGKKLFVAGSDRVMDFTSSSIDRLFFKLYTWFAEEERASIKARQKTGIARKIRETGEWGRKKKQINERQYKRLKDAGVSDAACARLMNMHPRTLSRRLHECGHGRDKIYRPLEAQ